MGRTRILILAVAAVAAIGLALVMRGLMGAGSAPPPAQTAAAAPPAPPMASVLVAARDLPAGTRLTAEDMRWQEFPVSAVTAAFITNGAVAGVQPAAAAPEPAQAGPGQPPAAQPASSASGEGDLAQRASAQTQTQAESFLSTLTGAPGGPTAALTGMVVRETIGQGEPITERKIVRGGDSGYMAVVLQPGMRAMAIPVSVETAAGGFILPGDRVDVIMSRQQQGAAVGPEFSAGTVLRNIRVLAIDQTVQPAPEAQSQVGATATLEVGAREAEVLALARVQGQLALTLRSYADMDEGSGVGSLAGQSSGPARPVRVWRGGQVTEIAQR